MTKKLKTRRTVRAIVDAALVARVQRLECEIELLGDDNARAREWWQLVYKEMYPQAIDGPRLGMRISNSIETILSGLKRLRIKAGIEEGRNAA